MTQGAALPPPEGDDRDRRDRAGVWDWARPVSIGLLLAFVLLVLLAGLLNDLIPGGGGGVITGPTPSPAPSVSAPPTVPVTPVPSSTASGAGGGGTGGGTGGQGGGSNGGGSNGGNNGGNGGNNGGGSNGGGGTDPTSIPTPTRTGVPTPTITPPVPPDYPVGPLQCTVRTPPGYCVTRDKLRVTVVAGRMSLTNSLGASQVGSTAALVQVAPRGSANGASVGGAIEPIILSDNRGAAEGWTLKAQVAWPGGLPPGVVVTVDPWCRIGALDAAPGLFTGRLAQSLDAPVTMCSKDGSVGSGGSTGGIYIAGGRVSLSTWIGTPIPATAVLVTFSLS